MSDLLDSLRQALADRYAVERELGRGGMATVFLAQDRKHRRPVAIKVLHAELAAALGAERFLREIEIAAGLQHPHILPLYDSGTAGGQLYYVMPYVEGESLRDRLRREKQLSLEDALRVATEVASALAYAHSRGFVHRDIKPENIMLSGGSAVVADFGIARAVTAAGERQQLTQTGTIIGTPAYMSPEQATGHSEIDGRSDEYSLACVVYEMLVGEPPFTGPTAQAVIARHSLDMVSPPSIVRATIPDAVEGAILRALSKVPADRYPTTALFAEALNTPSAATGAVRRATLGGGRGAPRPRRGLLRALPLAAAVVIVGGYVTMRSFRSTRVAVANAGTLDPRHVAVLYFADDSRQRGLGYLADGLTEGLIDRLSQVQPLQVVSRDGVAAYRSAGIPRDSVARALGAGSLITGSVEDAGDRVRVAVRLVDGTSGADIERGTFELPRASLLQVRDSLAQEVAGFLRRRVGEEIRLREQRAGTRSVDAWVLVQQAEKARKHADSLTRGGDLGGAVRAFTLADSLLIRAEELDPGWVEPIVMRAVVAYRRSRSQGQDPVFAAPFIEAGLAHAARALQRDPNNARALEMRGTLRYWRWLLHLSPDATEAAALLRSAEQDLRGAVGNDPSLASAWSTLSHLDYQNSQLVQAKIDAQRAYEADAYFSAADVIVWRLFTTSYDLEQLTDADHWCEVGQRRFAAGTRFVECQLWMLTTKISRPGVDKAWALVAELQRRTPEPRWKFDRLKAQMAVAAVLARAGLKDSARHLLAASRGNVEIDPTHDLEYFEAFARTLLGDRDEALRLLAQYVAARAEARADLARDSQWWFRDLRSDPRYQTLAGIAR